MTMCYITAAIIMLIVAVQGAGALKCEADHDCLQGHYCYGQSNKTRTCTPCISCAFYKRAVLANPACAHSALDCGDCLPGFQEESLTSSKRHYCMPTPLPETPHDPVSAATLSIYLVGSISFVGGVLICVALFMWSRRKRNSTTSTNERENVENAVCHQPPPYEESGNHIPLLETVAVASKPPECNKENESSFCLHVDEKTEESLVQANPFKRAREPYHDSKDHQNSDPESSSSGLSDTESYPTPNAPNAPDLNDEDTVPSTWTYHDSEEPAMDNAVVAEDFNDSGLSSQTTSTGSLADPLRLPGERTVVLFSGFSFAGCVEDPTEQVTSNKRERDSPSAMKRARRNSSPVESTDSDEPDTPLGRVMDSAVTEDHSDVGQSIPSSRTTYNTTLHDSTQLMTGQGTMVFSFSFANVADADRSNNEPGIQRVSVNVCQCQHSSDNGSRSMKVGPNMSSADDTQEGFVDNSSQPHVPPDRVIVL